MIYYIENKELEQYIRVLKNLMGSRLQLAQKLLALPFLCKNPAVLQAKSSGSFYG